MEVFMDPQQSMMAKLIDKAEKDEDFRRLLLSDSSLALKEAFDIDLPNDFNLVVHEDNARTAHLVLPASPELTDAQLQQAAGGFCSESEWLF